MKVQVSKLRGMSEELTAKLKERLIADSDALLAACRTPANRKELADALGIDGKALLKLANHADLARIKGIAEKRSELLETIGVDTVRELAHRNPTNLQTALAEANAARGGRLTPTVDEVTNWINQAKELPHGLEY